MSSLLKELTDRLQRALDKDHNVTDRDTVYHIIGQLPTVYVNKELLETTRIARLVNDMRRKTSDVELARKCKSLLKEWRQAVLPNQPTTTTTTSSVAPKVEPPIQNGAISTNSSSVPDGVAAVAYHHNFNHHSNSSSRISPGMGPTMVRGGGGGGHLYNNNSSINNNNRMGMHHQLHPTASTTHSVRSQPPMEIINLVDDRSNSPQLMFAKRSGKRSHSPSPARMDMAAAAAALRTTTTGSANRWTTNSGHSSFRLESSNTSTCDNENFVDNDSNVSRKHKKHKKDKKSKQLSAYNHVDERSAPSILLEDSLSLGVAMPHVGGSSLPNNHLILPDNDSLSNTSASIFNSAGVPPTPTTPLNFAGHFSRSEQPFEPPPFSSRVPTVVGLESRSASPHIFTTNNSSEPYHDVAAVVPDPMPEMPPAKVQKKRGRKKGSKGIDSLLASQNEGAVKSLWHPDSYQDLKQKITCITTGPKKNKTAMELLAEIQSKRPGSGNVSAVTSPSVTQAPSPSSLSDKSHQSQSTEISISAAVSPEPPKSKEESKVAAAASTSKEEKLPEDIELQIKRLHAQLPPIYKTDDDDEEDEVDVFPKCTCSFREVTEEEDEERATTGGDGGVNNIEINIVRDSDEEVAAVQARQRLKAKKRKKKEKVAVKSIFDLDDDIEVTSGGAGGADTSDDSDDDLESVPDKTEVMNVLVANEFPARTTTVAAAAPPIFPLMDDAGEPIPEMPKFTKYEAIIDPDCAAMEYFETNRNQVTNFHVQALHARFVPCVNGNWSRPIADTQPALPEDVSIATANCVVPRYNFLVCDKIPKQFPEKYQADSPDDNNGKLPTFNELNGDNVTGQCREHEAEFREWYQTVQVQVTPENDDENLTILPYVVID